VVVVAFFILAIQLFVTLIEFKLTTLAGFILVPFGLFSKTAFLAERVLGHVVASGVKVLVLAVIVGIGTTLFGEFTQGFSGNQPSLEDALALVLAALSLLGLGIFGPGIATGLTAGAPQLGAGAAVGTALAAGGLGVAGAAAARTGAGALVGAARGISQGVTGKAFSSAAGETPPGGAGGPLMLFRRASVRYGRTPEPETPYQKAAQVWDERIGSARVQARNWRLIAFGNLFLAAGLAGGLIWQAARGTVTPWVVEVDKLGEAQAISAAVADYRPTDPQIAWHLARFVENVRAIPADPVIVRQNWLAAYDFITDKGAVALNDYARANDPFAKVGRIQVAVDISSVIRASNDSFRVAWIERRYENASLAATERWTAILTIVLDTPHDAERLRKNPLGVFVHAINWSKELG
jgi:type IV secretion system protein TrbF